MFTSKALTVFVTLYQEKSLKIAAEKLCLTVPPVTRMLKLTEEWVGEKLFIVERNSLIPTAAARCIYERILPHYYELESFNQPCHERKFILSSPQINTSIFTDLLQSWLPSLPSNILIRNSQFIHSDDDIFISLIPSSMPPYFELLRTDIVLELISSQTVANIWKELPLLTEKPLEQISHFKKAVSELRARGFNGKLRRIDNINLFNKAFSNGEGLMFSRPAMAMENTHTLPFIYHNPLYIYVNKVKRDVRHEKFISHITKMFP